MENVVALEPMKSHHYFLSASIHGIMHDEGRHAGHHPPNLPRR